MVLTLIYLTKRFILVLIACFIFFTFVDVGDKEYIDKFGALGVEYL